MTEPPPIEPSTPESRPAISDNNPLALAPLGDINDDAGFVERWRTKALDSFEGLQRRRETSAVVDTVLGSVEHESEVGGGLLAGAIAFRLFLFLVPYVFVMVFALGWTADATSTDPRDLSRKLGMTGLVASAVNASSSASLFTRIATMVVAVYALFSGARKMVKALRITHALIWRTRIQKLRRPTLVALGFIGVFTLAIGLVHLAVRLWSLTFIGATIATAALLAIPTGTWLYCSLKLFPRPEGTDWRDVLPGSILVGTGIWVLHVITVVWFSHEVEKKSQTYGALGLALALLLWAYMVGRFVTASVALNVTIRERRLRTEV